MPPHLTQLAGSHKITTAVPRLGALPFQIQEPTAEVFSKVNLINIEIMQIKPKPVLITSATRQSICGMDIRALAQLVPAQQTGQGICLKLHHSLCSKVTFLLFSPNKKCRAQTHKRNFKSHARKYSASLQMSLENGAGRSEVGYLTHP